ncbi:carbon-nitrogen family hydrolase [Salinicoccus jeotgali]|uniref:Carbon-nitrogen family hydrolase n=1 Tax=Salinicoccus jeotgali TaxID=381634 RepID=A0ABP7ELX2_9STAP
MGDINVKVLQYQVEFGDFEGNLNKVRAQFEQETLEETDIVVLPEMWTSGYDLEHIAAHACHDLEPALSFISELAQQYNVNIVAGSVANIKDDPDKVYNTAFVVDREGTLVYEYSKMHLVPMLDEPKHLAAGDNKVETFMIDGSKCGMVICYDLRFPELFRDLTLKGASIIFVPAQWPDARKKHWETLLSARAIENQCYIIGANTYGEMGGQTFAGRSMITDPWGEVISEAKGQSEAVVSGQIDSQEVARIRQEVPIFESRRRDMYHCL